MDALRLKGSDLDIWRYETDYAGQGYKLICGVDEAGRGPLAGPVFAAAVILSCDCLIDGLNDSKKLSEKKRDLLFGQITQRAVDFGIGISSPVEIDEVNILNATFLAMNRAVDSLKVTPDMALVDGNRDPGLKCSSRCIVGGDFKSASIAAASILAKVGRDRYMLKMSKVYPQYDFHKHKGYGTRLHYEKLNENGPSEIHRRSFLKKWEAENNKSDKPLQNCDAAALKRIGPDSRERGILGEGIASDFLKSCGYTFLESNFRSYLGEIDLIVRDEKHIVFVEVKLRKNADFAHALEYVGKEKQRKIIATASFWLSSNKSKLQPRFDVIEVYLTGQEKAPVINHIKNAF